MAIRPNGEISFENNGNSLLHINPNGDAAIKGGYATPSPFTESLALTVNGSLSLRRTGSEEWEFRPSSTGAIFVYHNGSQKALISSVDGDWNSTSDARLKENILPYKAVLPGIKNIHVSTFRYKSNAPDTRSFGLIAQDVAQYFPEIVSEFKEKNGSSIFAIAYGKTGVLAIKAIQEQQVIIEKQQQQIDELGKRLAALEKIISK